MRPLAIFDLDGVIIDSEAVAAEILAAGLTGQGYTISADEVIERFIGLGIGRILARIEAERGICWPARFQQQLEHGVESGVFESMATIDGIERILLSLPADGWCIASNSNQGRIASCLERSGLSARFAPRIFSAGMVRQGKPAPDLFLLAAGSFGTPPARCVVVEDTVVGVLAGKAAGMQVIGFLGGSHNRHSAQAGRLKQAGADALAGNASELAGLLRQFRCIAD